MWIGTFRTSELKTTCIYTFSLESTTPHFGSLNQLSNLTRTSLVYSNIEKWKVNVTYTILLVKRVVVQNQSNTPEMAHN